jgi:hypothetical protein
MIAALRVRILLLAAVALFPASAAEDVWTGVDRIVAVGDIHGDYAQLVAVLESASLIDARGNWDGGRAHLVQMGDILDRGPDSRKALELLMRLEPQAIRAGGRVHCLIGNHETMVMYGDFRYVSPGEYAAFRAEDRRLAAGHPPGYTPLRAAFRPGGRYGKWIARHNTVIRIGDTVFVHAGLSPAYARLPIRQINDRVRSELEDPSKLRGGIVLDSNGPFWYRGMAEGPEPEIAAEVDSALRALDASRFVIGHATTLGAVMPRLGGKIVLTDVGLSRVFDPSGRQACLVIERGKLWALHRGRLLGLPDSDGPALIHYLKEAAALDPLPSPLESLIARLEASLAAPAAP